MNDTDTSSPRKSALSRSYSEDGKTLQIDIASDGKGGWLLEVADKHGNTTSWEDPFPSEQAALDEALAAIAEEGIDLFLGPAGGYGA
jgi:hypothetical protein